jgi:5-oxoprolinase (ATP-hydrolysing)
VEGAPWQVWIDTGGTFTDCLARAPDGSLRRAKVLSSSALRCSVREVVAPGRMRIDADWAPRGQVVVGLEVVAGGGGTARVADFDGATGVLGLSAPLAAVPGTALEIRSAEEAPILAARLATGTPVGQPLPPLRMRLATTRGTNALLERRGAPTALFVTRGFADLLEIGTQQRPDLFALDIRRPPPLHAAVVEVDERLAADGSVVRPLAADGVREAAARLRAAGIVSAAVALAHAYRDPRHERAVAAILHEAGFAHVAVSSALAPFLGLLDRARTAVVDAYLGPVLGGYLSSVSAAVGPRALHVTTSAGGLVRPEDFRAKDGLLSGPAGGVVGAARVGARAGERRVIAFDMGGTSTDVARFDGDFEYVWEHEVGGARILAPALAIESVAAGGGSLCVADARGLRVGPESAGAVPGPACYGAGGPLTLTDCNLLVGRLDPSGFTIPVDRVAAAAAAEDLLERVAAAGGERPRLEALLSGLLELADERMADAIRAISLRRGYDPSAYALVAFGGAGGQHACGVAARLGIGRVIVPVDAGLLSAWGIGQAALERFAERQVLRPLEEVRPEEAFDALGGEAIAAVAAEGLAAREVEVRRRIASLRFTGQDAALEVEWRPGLDLGAAFRERHRAVYGYLPAGRSVEVVSLRAVASSREPAATARAATPRAPADPASTATTRSWTDGAWREVSLHRREALRAGERLEGPALVTERHSATWVAAGWEARVLAGGDLLLERGAAVASAAAVPEVVRRELFVARFRALAGEMGEVLRRTALSTNVKERLDFSCALLDAAGELVVNAPHIPVHLGALGLCVRAVREALPVEPGDVLVTNHPAFGGSHLPDVTVVTPVHGAGDRILGWVASRAHHAEIGGSTPGSMPPAARALAEEGVVIPPMHLVRGGEARWEEVRALLEGGPFPSRAVEENLADLAAAVAANHRGAGLLRALAREHGAGRVAAEMGSLQRRAENGVRAALRALGDGAYEAEERLDDGTPLRVRIEVVDGTARFDFAGTGGVHPGNLNATPAIVRSVVLYVLRLLVREPLPLNEGIMRAVRVDLPRGLLNPPFPDDAAAAPAVVGGNTEVSQRLAGTLIRALGLSAGSQGTMNNVLWGTERFGYYETVCGGAGAGPAWDGADAVHSHMTNTRITDVEVVEHRYPVRIERFAIRRGSGGAGGHRGGDGAVRETLFLAPVTLSVLTQHRAAGPFGVAGGAPGAPGRQRVVRASGEVLELGAVDGCAVGAGDRLVLETPGGGGWGA